MKTLEEKWNTPLTEEELNRLGFTIFYKLSGAFDMAYIPDDLARPMNVPEVIFYHLPTPADLFLTMRDGAKAEAEAAMARQLRQKIEDLVRP